MEIYILRHGIAENGYGLPDRERALTAEGREKLGPVLAMAKSAGAAPGVILTSPLRRAVQTAEIAAGIFAYPGRLIATEALTPDGAPEEVWRELAAHRNSSGVLLVSHEPLVSQLTAYLLGVPQLQVWMRPGTFVCLDLQGLGGQPRGLLKYVLPAP